jgi:hypothetical protein
MHALTAVLSFVLGILALRGMRWAYAAFILNGLAYFPLRVGFELEPRACQLGLSPALIALSMTNYAHIVLFAIFFIISVPQFRPFGSTGMPSHAAFAGAAVATLIMGAAVEAAQGITGEGNCRLRDLVPDTAGIFVGLAAVALWYRVRKGAGPRSPAHTTAPGIRAFGPIDGDALRDSR